jgi:hypothetical protein
VLDDTVLTLFEFKAFSFDDQIFKRSCFGRCSLTLFKLEDRVQSNFGCSLEDRVGRCSSTLVKLKERVLTIQSNFRCSLKDRVGRCSSTLVKLKDRVERCSLTWLKDRVWTIQFNS